MHNKMIFEPIPFNWRMSFAKGIEALHLQAADKFCIKREMCKITLDLVVEPRTPISWREIEKYRSFSENITTADTKERLLHLEVK